MMKQTKNDLTKTNNLHRVLGTALVAGAAAWLLNVPAVDLDDGVGVAHGAAEEGRLEFRDTVAD